LVQLHHFSISGPPSSHVLCSFGESHPVHLIFSVCLYSDLSILSPLLWPIEHDYINAQHYHETER